MVYLHLAHWFKNFGKQHFVIFLSHFPGKIGFDISLGENLGEMWKSIFWKNKKKISIFCQLNLPRRVIKVDKKKNNNIMGM